MYIASTVLYVAVSDPDMPRADWFPRLRSCTATTERVDDGDRDISDAGASAGAEFVRRNPVGSRHHRVGRPAGLCRGLGRGALHRAVGADLRTRPSAGAGADADEVDQARARCTPLALSPPGRTRPPGGLFRPPRPGSIHAG